jgi:8-oxo-dGTP pyrophosphatase MutT (NUDIX family)
MFTWITRFIERHQRLHEWALAVWRLFPPRMAGFLKGVMARNWLVGAVAVMVDESRTPPEVLLVEHSYRPRGAWGLPGGSLESAPGDPTHPSSEPLPDDVIEYALRREVMEELGMRVVVDRLLRIDAIPFVAEEPGPYRLDFFFRCAPDIGFPALREGVDSGRIKPSSPEITRMRLVPLTDLGDYDIFSTDERFLKQDLPRLEPALAIRPGDKLLNDAGEPGTSS